jgi:hypothetical protein
MYQCPCLALVLALSAILGNWELGLEILVSWDLLYHGVVSVQWSQPQYPVCGELAVRHETNCCQLAIRPHQEIAKFGQGNASVAVCSLV